MSRREPKDPLQPLREVSNALGHAERAVSLLDDVWQWYGPYGYRDNPLGYAAAKRAQEKIAADPDLRAAFAATQMPQELHNRLRAFFEFDDSE